MRKAEDIQIGDKTLKKVLELHKLWIGKDPKGERAILKSEDLTDVDLYDIAYLRYAFIQDTNFSGSYLNMSDFRGATIINTDYSYSDLTYAKFTDAKLDNTEFLGAWLMYSDFGDTNHVLSNFKEANLYNSNLFRADLRKCNFKDANLSGAKLTSCQLTGADFENVTLESTLFSKVDNLEEVKNLNKCIHQGPSIVDISSIPNLNKLPTSFLLGVGFSEKFIDYYPSIFTGRVFEYYSCFISFSSKDEKFAKRLRASMQEEGLRTWFALEDMKIGDRIRDSIDMAIRTYDKLLIVLSENSIESQWVEQEVESALEKERKEMRTILFPVRIDDSVFDVDYGWAKLIKNTRNIGDFTNWKNHDEFTKAFERLVRDLKKEMG